jgi:glycine/D-amino acid oxidase-like deaminating enzyme
MHRRNVLKLLSAPVVARFPGWSASVKSDRVVIAGSGIIGASIAYHLAKRGAQVTVLEKQRPGAGATEKSFAWINATFSKQPRAYYELNSLGIAGWRRLQIELGNSLKVQWGGSVEWEPEGKAADELRENIRRHQQWGYATHVVDEPEFQYLLPGVSSGPMASACHCEYEGTVDPMQALGVLIQKGKDLGARFEYPCEVTGIDISGGRVRGVQSSKGSFEADALILAAGVGTPALARLADIHVPLQQSPGVLAHTTPQARLLDRVVLAPGANIKQNPDGRIVTGSDFGGTPTLDTSKELGERLLRNAARFLPKLKGAALENVTLGYRVLPQDEYPIIGFTERCANLYIAAMHSGITLSPLVGQLAALEILDGARAELLKPYRPSRFVK